MRFPWRQMCKLGGIPRAAHDRAQHGHHACFLTTDAAISRAARRAHHRNGRYLQYAQHRRRYPPTTWSPSWPTAWLEHAHRILHGRGITRPSWLRSTRCAKSCAPSWPRTARAQPSCWCAVTAPRATPLPSWSPRRSSQHPAQGRYLRRRRQLGPRAVRYRLCRGGRGCKQGRRVNFRPTGSDSRLPRRCGRGFQRGNRQGDPHGRRSPSRWPQQRQRHG